MIGNILAAIGESSIGLAIAESPVLFPWLEVIHVTAISILLGTLLIVDLRLLGLAARDYPVSRLTRTLLPLSWGGFALAALSGGLLFTSQAALYFDNWHFRAKLVLLLLAGINMALFHLLTARGAGRWDRAPIPPPAARAAGAASLLLWVLVAAAGRWIGFSMVPF